MEMGGIFFKNLELYPPYNQVRESITLRYLATGESVQSLNYQFRILLNAISYTVKGCCKAIVDKMALAFKKVPTTKA